MDICLKLNAPLNSCSQCTKGNTLRNLLSKGNSNILDKKIIKKTRKICLLQIYSYPCKG